MRLTLSFPVLVLTIVLLSACVTSSDKTPDPTIDAPTSDPTMEAPASAYTHDGLGMAFPEAVGGFQQLDVTEYDSAANDVGIGYRNGTLLIEATVFVYPSRRPTPAGSPPDQQHFEGVKSEIEAVHEGAAVVRANDDTMLAGHLGKHASYQFEAVFAGERRELTSDVYLFGIDDWYIKYRFTYPEDGAESSSAAIRQFMEELGLPAR
jgi:hypothetical protein